MDLFVCLIFGLAIGSFLNVCIARLPQDESIVHPRSRCPHCRKLIAWYDNIPVLSYLVLRGRCRSCKKSISLRYPGIELLTGIVSVLLYYKFGLSVEWGVFLGFSAALVVLAFIDLDHRFLPDGITINGIWIGVVVSVALVTPSTFVSSLMEYWGYSAMNPRLVAFIASLGGAVVAAGLLWVVGEVFLLIRGIEGMGFGDVKMMAMVGAFLGMPLALLTIMIGSILGAIIGGAVMYFGGKDRLYEIPFGTFLSLAGIVALLYGDSLIQWYFVHMIRPAL